MTDVVGAQWGEGGRAGSRSLPTDAELDLVALVAAGGPWLWLARVWSTVAAAPRATVRAAARVRRSRPFLSSEGCRAGWLRAESGLLS